MGFRLPKQPSQELFSCSQAGLPSHLEVKLVKLVKMVKLVSPGTWRLTVPTEESRWALERYFENDGLRQTSFIDSKNDKWDCFGFKG